MPDMLVNLLNLPDDSAIDSQIRQLEKKRGIRIYRPIAPDKKSIVKWVEGRSGISAASECDICMARLPISCYIAVKEKEIIGYACYNGVAPDFFGPTYVEPDYRGGGLGKLLLLRCLLDLRSQGYVYGIIGGVGPAEFYEKTIGAVLIENSAPGIYRNFLNGNSE